MERKTTTRIQSLREKGKEFVSDILRRTPEKGGTEYKQDGKELRSLALVPDLLEDNLELADNPIVNDPPVIAAEPEFDPVEGAPVVAEIDHLADPVIDEELEGQGDSSSSEEEELLDPEEDIMAEAAAAAAAAAARRKELNSHFTSVVEKYKPGVRNVSIVDWLKRVDDAAQYLRMTYQEKLDMTKMFIPDDVKSELVEEYMGELPHPDPEEGGELAANWNFVKLALKAIVDDSAAQDESLSKLKELEQGDDSVSDYLLKFKMFLKRTSLNGHYEAKDESTVQNVIELFIAGLDPDIIITGNFLSLEAVRDVAVKNKEFSNLYRREVFAITQTGDYETVTSLIDTCSDISTISVGSFKRLGYRCEDIYRVSNSLSSVGGVAKVIGQFRLSFLLDGFQFSEIFQIVNTNLYEILLGADFTRKHSIKIQASIGKEVQLEFPADYQRNDSLLKELWKRKTQLSQVWINGNIYNKDEADWIPPAELIYDEEADLDTMPFSGESDGYEYFCNKIDSLSLESEIKLQLKKMVSPQTCARGLKDLSTNGVIGIEYDIELQEDFRPVKSRPYRLGYILEYLLAEEIEKYVSSGRWSKGNPSSTSPVFLHLVPKQRNIPWEFPRSSLKSLQPGKRSLKEIADLVRSFYSIRLVHDYRRVNQLTHNDPYMMPGIQDFRRFTHGKKIFSLIDLKAAFYQISLTEKTKQALGITTPIGDFVPNFLTFGPKNAPAVSSRLLTLILEGLHESCMGRIDDIIVASSSIEDHMRILKKIFDRMAALGISINVEKTSLFQSSVEYMGFVVNQEGISLKDQTIFKLRDFKLPESHAELKSLNGLLEWMKPFSSIEFIEDMIIMNGQLSRKEFGFTQLEKEAFMRLKTHEFMKLVHPNWNEKFTLTTDASSRAVHGILSQSHGTIGVCGRKLSIPEFQKGMPEKELIGVVYSTRSFYDYLSYNPFLLRVDPSAFKYLLDFRYSNSKIYRWSIF
jgi:hypothetical protein